jgi:hypothetical protein
MRLVKMGDLVAVGIHVEDARVLDNRGDPDATDDSTIENTAFLDHEYVLALIPPHQYV